MCSIGPGMRPDFPTVVLKYKDLELYDDLKL